MMKWQGMWTHKGTRNWGLNRLDSNEVHGVGKLWAMGQTWPVACFCKKHLIGPQNGHLKKMYCQSAFVMAELYSGNKRLYGLQNLK